MHPKRSHLDGRDPDLDPKSVHDFAQDALRSYTPPVSETEHRLAGYRSTKKADAATVKHYMAIIRAKLAAGAPVPRSSRRTDNSDIPF